MSLALADILRERTGISARVAWVCATVPPLVLVWAGWWHYLQWLRVAAGATAVVVALITLPMYRRAQREGVVTTPEWTLGRWGHPVMQGFALLALVVMAVGSVVAT